MDLSLIASMRLHTQKISDPEHSSVQELVGYMGAIQAQDFVMAKWALGLRMQHADESMVNDAINKGEIIRTHVMRPTWHFVSSKDVYWMLELTGSRILSSVHSRHKQLELDPETINKSLAVIEKTLAEPLCLSNDIIGKALVNAGIPLNRERLSHLLFCAELKGLVCNGNFSARKQTYSLLSKWVPEKKALTKEEALTALANRYFTSHGPATINDYMWWSGLNNSEARRGIENNRKFLITGKIGSEEYFFSSDSTGLKSDTLVFLPAFDEFLISYKNREASIHEEGRKKAISVNGIFRPIIIFNGSVIGLWKKELRKDTLLITTGFFGKQNKKILALLEPAALKYAHFMGIEKIKISESLLT